MTSNRMRTTLVALILTVVVVTSSGGGGASDSYHTCLEVAVDQVEDGDSIAALLRVSRRLHHDVQSQMTAYLTRRLHLALVQLGTADPNALLETAQWAVQHLERRPDLLPVLTLAFDDSSAARVATGLAYACLLDPDVVLAVVRVLVVARLDGLLARVLHGAFVLARDAVALTFEASAELAFFDVLHGHCLDVAGVRAVLAGAAATLPPALVDAVWDEVDVLGDVDSSLRGRVPDPFSRIGPGRGVGVAERLASRFPSAFRARPDLIQTLFGLGLPMNFVSLPWVDYSPAQVRSVIPFVYNVMAVFDDSLDVLCDAAQADVLAELITCDEFVLFDWATLDVERIVRSLVEARRHDWYHPRTGGNLLHVAVAADCPGAVRAVLDAFPGLVQVADYSGRLPQHYAIGKGDQIQRLL